MRQPPEQLSCQFDHLKDGPGARRRHDVDCHGELHAVPPAIRKCAPERRCLGLRYYVLFLVNNPVISQAMDRGGHSHVKDLSGSSL
jgi:hypothetical protein